MNTRAGAAALIGVSVAYLAVLSLTMEGLSYDIWGFFVIAPFLAVLGVFGIRRMFTGELRSLVPVMYVGLAAKFGGAIARYFIAFDVYGGNSDSERYHLYARSAAAQVWRGTASITTVLPGGTGTRFMERFTSFLYTMVGASKLAAFLWFSWFAFWGAALFVKAACIAVPRLQQRRYALLCALAPSIVYWPSSVGKEAWMMFWLGLSAYGFALLLARRGIIRSVLIATLGLAGAAAVRPHMSGLWLAGLLPALLVALLSGRRTRRRVRGVAAERAALITVLVIAVVALVVVGTATVRYLNPTGDDGTTATSDRISTILAETTRRTDDGNSNFRPPTVSGIGDWPYASLRTLTRPLPIEAEGAGQLVSAAEILAFLLLCLAAHRRSFRLPKLIVSNGYIAFAMTSLFFGGLAYSTFANLGLLTRQKSLLFPLMLLIPCLPLPDAERRRRPLVDDSNIRIGLPLAAAGVGASFSRLGNGPDATRSGEPRRF